MFKKIRRRRAQPRPPRAARTASRRSADRMKLVLDISRLLAVTDLSTLLARIGEAAASFLDAEKACVFLHEPGATDLWTMPVAGGEVRRVPLGSGVVSRVYETGQVVEVADDDGPLDQPGDAAVGAVGTDMRSRLCAPLRDLDRQTIGVVEVVHKKTGRFTPEDRVSIELLAEHAALAIQRFRLLLAATQGSELRREMELAQRVQAALTPLSPPRLPGWEAAGWAQAASVTGGDCYDLWKLPDGTLAVFLADASGHGLAAALVISQVRAVLRALAELRAEPQWLLERINARLAEDLDEGRFVTAFVGVFAQDGWVQWSSAGQGPVFLRIASGARFEAVSAPAVPLGVSHDLITDPPTPLRLQAGGMLVVMSDGVFEAPNVAGEFFGASRAGDLLAQVEDLSADEVLHRLRDAVRVWQGRDEPVDDQTIVVVRRPA